MEFSLTEDQSLLLAEWQKALDRDIGPVTKRYLDTCIPKEVARELLKKTGEFGVGNGWVPEGDGARHSSSIALDHSN